MIHFTNFQTFLKLPKKGQKFNLRTKYLKLRALMPRHSASPPQMNG